MTIIKASERSVTGEELLVIADRLFEQAGQQLGDKLSNLKQDDEAAVGLKAAVKEVADSWRTAMNERHRLADERRKERGLVGDYAIDMGAARDEIERRLAHLRAARGR